MACRNSSKGVFAPLFSGSSLVAMAFQHMQLALCVALVLRVRHAEGKRSTSEWARPAGPSMSEPPEAENLLSVSRDTSEASLQPLSAAAKAEAVKARSAPGIRIGGDFQNLIAEPTTGAAYLMVDWAPSEEEALKVEGILKGTYWPGWRRDHATIQSVKDFVWLYTGSGVFASNIERCTRGAVALNPGSRPGDPFASMGAVADIFDGDPIEATTKAIQFTAGLCAALALIPSSAEPVTLFRGALEPPDIEEWLQSYVNSGDVFAMPGLASTAVVKEHAVKFMGKGPYRHRPNRGVDVLYEYLTVQAKDVRDVNPDESEWILPPNRKFKVLNVTEVARNAASSYLHVKLVDAI